jgi:hypothetical protein
MACTRNAWLSGREICARRGVSCKGARELDPRVRPEGDATVRREFEGDTKTRREREGDETLGASETSDHSPRR